MNELDLAYHKFMNEIFSYANALFGTCSKPTANQEASFSCYAHDNKCVNSDVHPDYTARLTAKK
jgi:hypothetical protein